MESTDKLFFRWEATSGSCRPSQSGSCCSGSPTPRRARSHSEWRKAPTRREESLNTFLQQKKSKFWLIYQCFIDVNDQIRRWKWTSQNVHWSFFLWNRQFSWAKVQCLNSSQKKPSWTIVRFQIFLTLQYLHGMILSSDFVSWLCLIGNL